MLITVPHPTSTEQDEQIQHFLLHPQKVVRPLQGCRICLPRRQFCAGLTCSGYTVLPRDNMDERLFLFPFHRGTSILQGRSFLIQWEVNGATGELLQKCRGTARCCPVPCNSLQTPGSIMPSTCRHHKRIVTGFLTYVKLTPLPKLFLGKRAAQKEGPQKSKKQSSLWNKVMSLARYCSMVH